jgi:hypothetical protein
MNKTINPWAQLVKRYADGRLICNCEQAYYSENGVYWNNGEVHHDGKYCKNGCQANQYNLKDEIAKRVLEELKTQQED